MRTCFLTAVALFDANKHSTFNTLKNIYNNKARG